MFLVMLIVGFFFNSLSAFTAWLCHHLGERHGRWMTFILRNVLGIPVWTIGLILAVRKTSPQLFAPSQTAEMVGWCLLATGCLVMILALGALRGRAAVPFMHDLLIQHGPYAYVRHPIHCGLLLALVSLVLLRPTQAAALAAAMAVIWIFIQSRFEELDLIQRLPAYRGYMAQVPRFIPRIRRLPA